MKVVISIEGMGCGHCIMAVNKEFEKLGIPEYDVEIGTAKIELPEEKYNPEEINKSIEEAGFSVVSHYIEK